MAGDSSCAGGRVTGEARDCKAAVGTRRPSANIRAMGILRQLTTVAAYQSEGAGSGGRFDLAPVAADFEALDTADGGRWTYTGSDSLDARLYRAGPDGDPVPSSLPLGTVEQHLIRVCESHP